MTAASEARLVREAARRRRARRGAAVAAVSSVVVLGGLALLYLAVTVPLARIVDRQQARARRRQGQVVAP